MELPRALSVARNPKARAPLLRAAIKVLADHADKLAAPMTSERAELINLACAEHYFYAGGFKSGKPPLPVADYSLLEMIQARDMVLARGPQRSPEGALTYTCTCDDRFLAALYAAYHHDGTMPDEPMQAVALTRNFKLVAVLQSSPAKLFGPENGAPK